MTDNRNKIFFRADCEPTMTFYSIGRARIAAQVRSYDLDAAAGCPEMTAIAKGPWVVCHDAFVSANGNEIQKWCVRAGDERGPLVAVLLTEDVARLIAAAPDMLGALQIIATRLSYGMNTERHDACLALARAVIAKATGELK